MQEPQSPYGGFDLMLGVGASRLDAFYPELAGQPISPDRKERIVRTLVRNLYTFHLQVRGFYKISGLSFWMIRRNRLAIFSSG